MWRRAAVLWLVLFGVYAATIGLDAFGSSDYAGQEPHNLLTARSLVDEPERVEVLGTESDSRVDLELRVAPNDMGRVIGRQGRTIRAIRTVVKAASVKVGKRVTVEVPD